MAMIYVDFETFYDKTYSLRVLTPVQYILDPRFEITGVAVIEGSGEPFFLEPEQIPAWTAGLKARQRAGEKITMLSHNALFDMCVMLWRCVFAPDFMLDTMGMARALTIAFTGAVSLEKLAEHHDLPAKGKIIKNMSGKTRAMIKEEGLWDAYVDYAKHDAWLCRELFRLYRPRFPLSEMRIMNLVLRAAVYPGFRLDADLLAEHKYNIDQMKDALLQRCGLSDRMDLMSNDKFAAALERLGVEPPMKTSPATGKQTYAFAKSDPAMIELAEHEDPQVQALVAARVGHKSTIEQTRTNKLLNIAMLHWPGKLGQGWCPIALRYSGAHTHRLSGDWGLNSQNWPKYTMHPDGSKETGKLRRAHKAPTGKKVVKADASQIEARIVAWLSGQDDLVEDFRQGRDVYSKFAGENIYNRPITKADTDERFIGKTCVTEETLVYTKRGLVKIIEVQPNDQLWDGVEWVDHQGVCFRGWKQTLSLSGVSITPDHKVLCGTEWREAQSLARDENTLYRALETAAASLKSRAISEGREGASALLSSSVRADSQNMQWRAITSDFLRVHAATLARRKLQIRSGIGRMLKQCLTTIAAPAYSIACRLLSRDAITHATPTIGTMAGEASMWRRNGGPTGQHSCDTPRLYPAGVTPILRWIERMSIKGTSPATSGSSVEVQTYTTSERSLILSRKLPVYDLLSTGPRNRFTIQTGRGPMIIHNCILGLGFGMGAPKFKTTVAASSFTTLGRSIIISEAESANIVYAYRTRFKKIKGAWDFLRDHIPIIASHDSKIQWGPVTFRHQWIELPNGMPLFYPDLRQEDGFDGRLEWVCTFAKRRKRMFGGKFFENIVQSLARIITMEAATRMEERWPQYPMKHQVHDDLVFIVKDEHVEDFRAALEEEMSRAIDWYATIPLACESGVGQNYGDAK